MRCHKSFKKKFAWGVRNETHSALGIGDSKFPTSHSGEGNIVMGPKKKEVLTKIMQEWGRREVVRGYSGRGSSCKMAI